MTKPLETIRHEAATLAMALHLVSESAGDRDADDLAATLRVLVAYADALVTDCERLTDEAA